MTTTVVTSRTRGTDNARGSRPVRVLALVLAAQFMALLDAFIVNVAAPTIQRDLSASGGGLQLVVAGYTIAYAVLLIAGARLGERFGHRRMYLVGLLVFTGASLACGLSTDTGQLIGFRLLQGAGAAVLIPQVLSLIQRTYQGEARVRALGAYSAVLATGAAAGQVLGGVLVSADLFGAGWRPVFLVNVPIGVVLLILGARLLPPDDAVGPDRRRGLDLPGLILLAAAVSLFTVPLVLGQEQDWPLWSWLSIGSSALLLGVFVVLESRLAARGGAPIIAPRVLRLPGMRLAVARILLVMAVNSGFLFVLALHFQGGLGHSALRAGLTFAPAAIVFGAVGLTWRKLPASLQGMLVPAGCTLVAVCTLAFGMLLRGGGDGGPLLYVAFTGVGAGLSLGFSPALTGALARVGSADVADASGILATVTQLGQLIGVAVFGALFLNRVEAAAAGGADRAQASADGLLVCAIALAAAALVGALSALVRARR
ncbi:putative transport protein HsrA [Streptomyces sp. YIM 130001]|uniref:MFS transporter n=1 Tax=Streptomyces sp. YIM 130001 TaxID=2259644 RepID=UPI000ECE6BD9|nr:MFS transporter [Streptomyces sp. YIM 130001]RII08713.1 putative transport protein HsrA [Streptomyces sp. YIM 130001]